MPRACHLPSLVLIAQAIFLLQCGRVTDRTDRSSPHQTACIIMQLVTATSTMTPSGSLGSVIHFQKIGNKTTHLMVLF